ncbi:MAG: serine/threonine-protein kinase [Planctomycetota bacterium]
MVSWPPSAYPPGGPTPVPGSGFFPGGPPPTPGGGLPGPGGSARFVDGRFEVLAELGRGGHGVVYRARDLASGAEVALKVLLGELSEARRKRLAREVELAGGLDHPGIVRIVAANLAAGRPWVAFELFPGAQTLAELQPRLPRERRLELLLGLARALGHAHAHGVVHRDLKPANVLVTARGQPLLIDFGVATGAEVDRLTVTGAWVGTPWYMSPEQLAGRRDVGPPADVWALGVLLYEMLADLRPFLGESVVELAQQVTESPPQPLRPRVPNLDPRLEAVCLRALAKDPGARFADAEAFADALELALLPAQRGRGAARAAALALVAAGALGLPALALARRDRAETTAASPTGEASPAYSAQPSATPSTAPAARPSGAPSTQPAPTPATRPSSSPSPPVDYAALSPTELRARAEAGEVGALVRVAESFLIPPHQDSAQAVVWLRRAADAGSADALANLGVLLSQGKGTPRDPAAANECYRRAAEQGSLLGMRVWAARLWDGDGVAADPEAGVALARRAAERGDAPAAELVGTAYATGKGAPVDRDEAERWLERAARGGRGEAMGKLGQLYLEGVTPGKPDHARALEWLKKGVAAKDPDATFRLGKMVYDGNGVEQNHGLGVRLWRDAALLGQHDAQTNLAVCLANGEDVKQDEATARQLFERAVAAGRPVAMHGLAVLLRAGRGGPADPVRATELERQAAERGMVDAMRAYADALARGLGTAVDLDAAETWLRKAAARQDVFAMRMLGFLLIGHTPGSRKCEPEAHLWLERALERGDLPAAAMLSLAYRQGLACRKDPARAHAYALEAQARGLPSGTMYVGDDYFQGTGVARDVAKGMALWREAASKGHVDAMRRLANAYEAGKDIPRDLAQARRWWRAMADRGLAEGKQALERLGGE